MARTWVDTGGDEVKLGRENFRQAAIGWFSGVYE